MLHQKGHHAVALSWLPVSSGGQSRVLTVARERPMVSSHGRVRSTNGVIHWGTATDAGYRVTAIGGRKTGVHRLVAYAFLGPPVPPSLDVNHKDFDRSNNRVGNLEYATRSQNIQHSWDHSPHRDRNASGLSKAVFARERDAEECVLFASMNEAARAFGLNVGSVYACCVGRSSHAGNYKFEYAAHNHDYLPNEIWSVALHPETGEPLTALQVSSCGRVKSKLGIREGTLTAFGYRHVCVQGGYYVHRLVARTFLGPCLLPGKWDVHHKDLNRSNNHVDNLAYATRSENIMHSFRANSSRKSCAESLSKPVLARRLGADRWTRYPSVSQAARVTGANISCISRCCRGVRRSSRGREFQYATTCEPTILPGEEWREIHHDIVSVPPR